jgi:hypothetical protein
MKKIKIFVLIILCFNCCFSETKKFPGEIFGLETDGKSIFTLMMYNKIDKLQIIYPTIKETPPLPPYKSFKRYYQMLNDKIVVLSDNDVFIFNNDLKSLKKIKLPDMPPDKYHFNYSLSMKNEDKSCFFIVIESNDKCFLLKDFDLIELKNEINFDGNKIEMKNNMILINGYTTDLKYKKFSSLVHFLFVLDNEFILVRNSLFDNSGRRLAELPFTFEVGNAILLENFYILFNPENIVILNKKGEMIKVIKEGSTGILGNLNQYQVVLKINRQYLGLLSLKTLDLKKKDLGEEISSAVLLDNKLFYVPRNNYKTLKIRPIKDIFVE